MDINEKISHRISNHKVNCILQVGNKEGNDIDLFVFIEENCDFLREVKKYHNKYYDISYMSIYLLKQGLNEKWSFLINALQSYEVLYKKNDVVLKIVEMIKTIKPNKLDNSEIDYYRFYFFEQLEALNNRKENYVNTLFFSYNILKEAIIFYFKDKQEFIPKDKKLLERLSKNNEKLSKICYDFILENDIDKKISILNKFIYEVLKPYGGLLKEWNKGRFPLL